MAESENVRLDSLVVERTSQLEKALDKAEAASQSKSLFLGKMSHEMCLSIKSLDWLQCFATRHSLEKQVRRLGLLNDATKRLDTLVQSILTLLTLSQRQRKSNTSL